MSADPREPSGDLGLEEPTKDPSDEATVLVVLSPAVLAEAEHALGNLFHRLHFFCRKAEGEGLPPVGETVASLEETFRLLFDYVSPLPLDLRCVPALAVVRSASAALPSLRLECDGSVENKTLQVDSGRLSHAFALLGRFVRPGEAGTLEAKATSSSGPDGGSWLCLRVSLGSVVAPMRLAWAVAEKIVESHGGNLVRSAEGEGEAWTLRLPLSEAGP
ncbi:MAG: hypothetical protein KatS3mg076_0470 [Candidatus Binatia bacterium]|nr:MAG: hypothetical protein KatS3mg076_0470 [Candidatus Binatia bacterium]